ncbi:MAG: hypothetical protein CME62_00725 [Halobacteriovoraceae bacterium]|nr:hypothetical protein [Halobacteriovoraceae bacterium]|tara:strand:- start:14680 stop:16173 length:1494 start_codon:yes stop_codon:yes gene_type:complete
MFHFVRNLAYIGTKFAFYQFQRQAKNPKKTFDELWDKNFKFLKNSPFWSEKIKPDLDQMPITTYSDYKDKLEESLKLGRNLLNGEDVLFWAQSAGTTGKRKLFPLTKTYQSQFQKVTPVFVHNIIRTKKSFLKDPALYLASASMDEYSEKGTEIGFISYFNYKTIPGLLQKKYVWPSSLLENKEKFYHFKIHYVLSKNIGAIFSVTPLSILELKKEIDLRWRDVLQDLRAQDSPWQVSTKWLIHLEKTLSRPSWTFKELFPHLDFICCWKSSLCHYQLQELKPLLGDVDCLDAIYSATEGWVNVPLDGDIGGPYHPGSHIVEFIKVGEEIIKENLLKPWELEIGQDYEVFFTTAMGMIRYRLFDIVHCKGFYYQTPILYFKSKEGSQISLGLVTVGEDELVAAVSMSGMTLNPKTKFAPAKGEMGLVFYTDDPESVTEEQIKKIHQTLKEQNINYKIYADKNQLKEIQVARWPKDYQHILHAQTKPRIILQTSPERD